MGFWAKPNGFWGLGGGRGREAGSKNGFSPGTATPQYYGALFRIVKYMSARAICKNLGMPYWQPTATSTSNYYVPSGSGIIPIITLGVNTIDGVPNSGTARPDYSGSRGTLIFKNMKQ